MEDARLRKKDKTTIFRILYEYSIQRLRKLLFLKTVKTKHITRDYNLSRQKNARTEYLLTLEFFSGGRVYGLIDAL